MGGCFSRGHTELKASFGQGNEVFNNSPREEFNKRYFEVSMDCDDKFQVFEGMTLLFLYWYYMYEKEQKKIEQEKNDMEYDTVIGL